MAIQSVSSTAWNSVVTTTAETVFQNRSVNPMYLTTESTSGLDFNEGFYLAPNEAVVIGAGETVSAVCFRYDSDLFYMNVS